MPKNVLDVLRIELVEHIDEVLKLALLPPTTPVAHVIDEPDDAEAGLDGLADGLTH